MNKRWKAFFEPGETYSVFSEHLADFLEFRFDGSHSGYKVIQPFVLTVDSEVHTDEHRQGDLDNRQQFGGNAHADTLASVRRWWLTLVVRQWRYMVACGQYQGHPRGSFRFIPRACSHQTKSRKS